MIEDKQEKLNTKQTKKFLLLIVTIAVVASTVLFSLIFWPTKQDQTIDEQLADIEVARAIPEAENAATIYNELLADPNATSMLAIGPDSLDDQTWNRVMSEPWRSKDNPRLVAMIKENQNVINNLLEVGQFEECRYPISIDLTQPSPLMMDWQVNTRRWAFLLSLAANNDVAEGQIDTAITKWRCILKMGNHHRQQPMLINHLIAPAVDRIAFVPLARFIVEGEATESYLRNIEAIPLPVTDNWTKILKESQLVEDMKTQKMKEQFGLFGHVMRGIMDGPDLDKINELYLKHITTARGIHILIALRHYKNKTGYWPESLEQIKDLVSQDILIDPQNNGPFVYNLTDNGFTLYSIGPNNIDEAGRDINGADDSPIWPLP